MSHGYFDKYEERPQTWRKWFAEVPASPLDMLRPIAPQSWRWAAGRLASGPGWTPPMALIAAMSGVFLSHALLVHVAFLHVPHLVTVGIVSLVAMYLVARRAAVVFPRYGVWGFTRPRWWFELGRVLWIVCILSVATAICTGFAGFGQVAIAGDAIFRWLMRIGGFAFVAFPVVATVAYLLSFARRLPRRGRAFECVQYFYGFLLAGAVATPAVVLARADRFALLPLCIGVVAAIAAGVVAFWQHRSGVSRSQRRRAYF